MAYPRTLSTKLSILALAALLVAAHAAHAAVPVDPVPGDSCESAPSSCPPAAPVPPEDPWEPMLFGVYKLKVKSLVKHTGAEAFEMHGQFPTLILETEDGFAFPIELLIDPLKGKMTFGFEPLAVPIFEAWLAQRLQDLLGEPLTVSLADAPKLKVKRKKDTQILKIKAKGTVTIGGETLRFKYKAALGSPFAF